MTLHERADKLLALREDLYEMHFHQVDREWLIEAMVDFAQLPQQETFVSKGSYVNGDIVTKDSVINELPTTTSDLIDSAIWSLPFEERMKCWELIEKLVEESQLPQQDISDEEILDAAAKCRFNDLDISVGSFELGARWYREQLKLKQ